MSNNNHKYAATCVLLNYNKQASLKEAIKSVRAQNIPIEVIVIDNSLTTEKTYFDCDKYINLGINLHCKIRFLLACYASGECIFTLDDDVKLGNPKVISHYLSFINNFSKKSSCVLTANGHNYYKHNKIRCEDVDGWDAVTAGKGRFLFFHKTYLESIPIGFHDFITTGNKTYTGFETAQHNINDIVIDDISFQQYAQYVFAPNNLNYNVITDQPSSGTGCHQKKNHGPARRWWLGNN